WPEIQVATEGMRRVLVQEQKRTAPISSGLRPDFASAISAASSEISSSERSVYRRDSIPVFSRISSADMGDQLKAVFRMRSSLVHSCSPFTAASASMRGCTAKRFATWSGGYGFTGGLAGLA